MDQGAHGVGVVALNDLSDDGTAEPSEVKQAAVSPITNAILSQAVTTAISQLDNKRVFDMMLLNEQMSVLESETKCAKEEAAFLRESLAKQTQETSEMYHYFHAKMDIQVETIGKLEDDLERARTDMEKLAEEHQAAMALAQRDFDAALADVNGEVERLRDELNQLHVFSAQKKQMEEQIENLQAELEAKIAQFAAERNALEIKAIFEKDRVKKEMLVHMKETKEELLLRTEDQLNTTTKRTMMENEHFMEELAYQSKETEKLLERYRLVEEEVQTLRVKNKVLEENEIAMAKKNHYYQKIVSQLRKQSDDLPKHSDMDAGDTLAITELKERLQQKCMEVDHLQKRTSELEESLRRAQQWIVAFQNEKQFVVAQQDEVIQFLCRTLREAASRYSGKLASVCEPRSNVSTMDELVSQLPPIAVDELSSEQTHQVLAFLLEKMRNYQQQVAMVYKGPKSGPTSPVQASRDILEKQLGVELPPIAPPAAAAAISPLKVKRRIQPYASSPVGGSRSSANQDMSLKTRSTVDVPPSTLFTVATSNFNFLQPSSLKSPPHSKKHVGSSPAKLSATRKAERSNVESIPMEEELTPSATGESLPSAWSTDSLPAYEGQDLVDSRSDPQLPQPKKASVSSTSMRRG